MTALTWACLQHSGPMDLKEKRAVGHRRALWVWSVRLLDSPCLCVPGRSSFRGALEVKDGALGPGGVPAFPLEGVPGSRASGSPWGPEMDRAP